MNDKTLRQNVIDELNYDPSIDSADIGVAAENGVVTLTGYVPTYLGKLAAERAAWRVKGVKAIAQEIEVRLPSDTKTNDDQIAQRALNILSWSVPASSDSVKVKVQDGYVTLTGTVPWNYQRRAIEASVRQLSGVRGVVNGISLRPVASQADVRDRITGALKRGGKRVGGSKALICVTCLASGARVAIL